MQGHAKYQVYQNLLYIRSIRSVLSLTDLSLMTLNNKIPADDITISPIHGINSIDNHYL